MSFLIISNSARSQILSNVPIDEFSRQFFGFFMKHLDRAQIKNVQVQGNQITYVGAPMRFAAAGFSLFNGISSGEIKFENIEGQIVMNYKMRFTEFFILALLFTIIPILGYIPEIQYRFALGAVIWIIYLLSCLITIYRFNNLTLRILIKINEQNLSVT